MCSGKIAKIERRVAARIPGQQIEMLFAGPFDDRTIGVELDDYQPLSESEEKVDDPGADAAGTANHDVSAAVHRAQALHGDPMHPRQKRSAEGDKETGQRDAGQHQQHRDNDFDRLAPVGDQVAISSRRHCRDNEVDGVEPIASEDSVKIPRPGEEHDQGDPGEPDKDRVQAGRTMWSAAQQQPHPASVFRLRPSHRSKRCGTLQCGNFTIHD